MTTTNTVVGTTKQEVPGTETHCPFFYFTDLFLYGMQRDMKILGIETSCDDTAAALIEVDTDGQFFLRAEKTASQIDIHKPYGGVVPEVAAREHAAHIIPVVEYVLQNQKPDIIAVTAGPGLITALLVGMETAKTFSFAWNIPLIPINHIEGHIYSALIPENPNKDPFAHFQFPALALVVSGGHSELILLKDHGVYERIGKTRDDAAGEAFDKVGKLLGFAYPGGPKISKQAKAGKRDAIHFPRPMLQKTSYEFSFAGLKTAARYWLEKHPLGSSEETTSSTSLSDFCASFEEAIVETLVTKTIRAVRQYQPKQVVVVGGVSANTRLREKMAEELSKESTLVALRLCPKKYSMDNAVMIALAGYVHALRDDFTPWQKVEANPNWRIV